MRRHFHIFAEEREKIGAAQIRLFCDDFRINRGSAGALDVGDRPFQRLGKGDLHACRMRRALPADRGVGVVGERLHVGAARVKRLVAFGGEVDGAFGRIPDARTRPGTPVVADPEVEHKAAVGIVCVGFADRVFAFAVPEYRAAFKESALSVHLEIEFSSRQDFDAFKRGGDRRGRHPRDARAGEKTHTHKLYLALFHNKNQKKILSVNCFPFDDMI